MEEEVTRVRKERPKKQAGSIIKQGGAMDRTASCLGTRKCRDTTRGKRMGAERLTSESEEQRDDRDSASSRGSTTSS